MTGKSSYVVPSVNKSIDIIILLSEKSNLTFKEICTELQLPVSTCFNLLNTLESRGFIQKNPTTSQYQLGHTLMTLGMQIYNEIDLRKIAYPFMEKLSAQHSETCYLSIVDDLSLEGIVLEKIDATQTLIVLRQVGSKFPLYASGTGKSLLAGFSSTKLDEYFKEVQLIPSSERTASIEFQLREELESIRDRGYARHDEMGTSSISAPIKNFQGKVVAAISLAGPYQRMQDKIPHFVFDVKETAQKISSLL